MAIERTLSIIKPDAVAKNVIGEIYKRFEQGGLTIVASKMLHLSRDQAGEFYAVHRERPFFGDLVKFMTSGPVVACVLEGDGAIKRWRDLMGPTNSNDAEPGTIRGDLSAEFTENLVHGSDSAASAQREIGIFFPNL